MLLQSQSPLQMHPRAPQLKEAPPPPPPDASASPVVPTCSVEVPVAVGAGVDPASTAQPASAHPAAAMRAASVPNPRGRGGLRRRVIRSRSLALVVASLVDWRMVFMVDGLSCGPCQGANERELSNSRAFRPPRRETSPN